MSVTIFVLGRPGSGKTTAVRHILELAERRNYKTKRMKDYDILYKMFQQDTHEQYFRATNYGGFDILDGSVYDVALQRLEKNVQEISLEEKYDIITIEFARDNYQETFRKLSSSFLEDSYFFFVEADLDTCMQRIYQRVTVPPTPDHHFVSEYIMRSYYNNDNWKYMSEEFQKEYQLQKEVVAYYNTGSLQGLIDKVSEFAETIFIREFVALISAPE
ncbi:hypothetical protein EPA93_36900 [Ktedonosporobacter rubrisoli]|uniref:UDP-N-acetylglucosamine kinase n=1 Tax=Ktedonosporobacter rubrisoli TaxID=2509675 RepID=A0A4P6K0U6_KTERU|nr:AAA family ATPase [Ktedonosporobacter rubrisoli]QBD81260.1 hypothetical protein EPA93_36900 [Ktedonosporobacter rubrisoli]